MTTDLSASYVLGRLLYTFLCSLPYMVLILYSFRGHWRFKRSVTFLLAFTALTFQMVTLPIRLYLSEYIPYQVFDILTNIVYIAFIFATIKDHIGKLIFTVLALTNLGDFVVVSAKCLEGIYFYDNALQKYYFTYHLFIVIVLAAALPLMYFLLFKDMGGHTSKTVIENGKAVKHPWRYLWLVPAVFNLISLHHFYANGTWDVETSMDPMSTLYLFAISAGSVLIYRIIVRSARLYEKNLSLMAENHTLSIQRLQYDSLNDRLENMRKTRHDLRHHTALLKQIRLSGDLSALDELINTYTEQNALDQPLMFCENKTVNIVLAFYSETAYKNSISFSVKADIPEDIFADSKDIAVVFGNVLENASDACREVEGERFIDITAAYKSSANGDHILTLVVKNSFATAPTVNENGVFNSTKHPGEGIGISSVKSIAEKYGGTCSFTHEDGVFSVSVILYEPLGSSPVQGSDTL
ncbi:MAG: sensor histidine kinase [Ruminococcus sp.]|nr:sensor histidine kinase [Ruminococcus sp.]